MNPLRVLVLALAVAGCAGARPQAAPAEPVVDAQRAIVYFFRRFGSSGIDATVATRDGAVESRLATGSYVVHGVRPGPLGVYVTTGHYQRADQVIEVVAGKAYYVEVEVVPTSVTIGLVDPRVGEAFVRSARSRQQR